MWYDRTMGNTIAEPLAELKAVRDLLPDYPGGWEDRRPGRIHSVCHPDVGPADCCQRASGNCAGSAGHQDTLHGMFWDNNYIWGRPLEAGERFRCRGWISGHATVAPASTIQTEFFFNLIVARTEGWTNSPESKWLHHDHSHNHDLVPHDHEVETARIDAELQALRVRVGKLESSV